MKEEVLLFGDKRTLVGTITNPSEARNGLPAVILLNAGVVHRVGPNRLYVKVARKLAEVGFVALRFDFSGIGDSSVRDDHLPFNKSAISETQEAMDCLSAARGIERFILMGICSGGHISRNTACCDSRVVGVALINTLYHYYTADIRRTVHACYYKQTALVSPQKWLNVLTGRANYRNIVATMGSQLGNILGRKKQEVGSQSDDFEANLQARFRSLKERGVRLLLVYNEFPSDMVYFQMLLPNEIREMKASGQLRAEIIPQAGHTFPLLKTQDHLSQLVQNWAHTMAQV